VNANFQYDAAGRRVSKTINGTATSFLYDGPNIAQEQSAQTGNANLLNGGLDEWFLRTDTSGSWSPLVDGLGSSLSLTDGTGASQTNYSYGVFGASTSTGAANNNSSQYTSRENDGTGLQSNRARYYSSIFQRFVTEDPLGFGGGDINLYGYVANSPTNFTDPSGLEISELYTNPAFSGVRSLNVGGRACGSTPGPFQALFGDGGVFTRQTLEEFISAKERARQPCKRFGERWWQNFKDTNDAIPGFGAPLGTTMITAPGAAQITGQPGIIGWALRGGGPGFGSSVMQSGLTALATHASFEGGVGIGSYISAVGSPCGYQK